MKRSTFNQFVTSVFRCPIIGLAICLVAGSASAQSTTNHESDSSYQPQYRVASAIGPGSYNSYSLEPETKADGAAKDPAKKADAAKKEEPHPAPTTNFDIYRDRELYPLDPRKPVNPCTQGGNCPDSPMGLRGRPYREREQGGCNCGDKKCDRHPEASIYWPRPFSIRNNERHPRLSGDSRRPRIFDKFDNLRNFKLINYDRTDNGYCGDCNGCGRDTYGCLGQSKHFSNVAGIGFRSPGQPINRGFNGQPSGNPQYGSQPLDQTYNGQPYYEQPGSTYDLGSGY